MNFRNQRATSWTCEIPQTHRKTVGDAHAPDFTNFVTDLNLKKFQQKLKFSISPINWRNWRTLQAIIEEDFKTHERRSISFSKFSSSQKFEAQTLGSGCGSFCLKKWVPSNLPSKPRSWAQILELPFFEFLIRNSIIIENFMKMFPIKSDPVRLGAASNLEVPEPRSL